MEAEGFISLVLDQLSEMGFSGAVIGIQLLANIALWVALQKERKRCEILVDKMFDMTREATVMIERITGR